MIGVVMSTFASAVRRLRLPLAVYYGITLALPLANGADWSHVEFLKHALTVAAIPLAMIALAGAVAGCWSAAAAHR